MANPVERLRLERLYVILQVYNKLFDAWYKLVTPPSLFVAGFAIVFAMNATIQPH